MKDAPILTEDTRFNLKFNNIYVLIVTTAMLVFAIAAVDKRMTRIEDKMDNFIIVQAQFNKDLKDEFKPWKSQLEGRLGAFESRQSQVITVLNQHLSVNIR